MAKTVVALYRDYSKAQQALGDLLSAGIPRDRISLIRKDDQPDSSTTSSSTTSSADRDDDKLDTGSGALIGGATGAVIGGTAGAFLAGVAGLVIPGLGAVLGVGPLAATIIGGAGIGAVSGGIAGALVNSGVSEEHAAYYESGVRQGGTLLTVHADDADADRAAEILSQYDPLDVENREEVGTVGTTTVGSTTGSMPPPMPAGNQFGNNTIGNNTIGNDRLGNDRLGNNDPAEYLRRDRTDLSNVGTPDVATPVAATVASGSNDVDDIDTDADVRDKNRLPVVEEHIDIAKRQVQAGVARVRTRVYERPVEEQVTLRDEKLNIERRPADRELRPGEDAFREQTIEVSETREEPVVRKEARVVGEVIVNKTAEEHTETVRDTVRKTEVEVDRKTDADSDRGMSGNSRNKDVLGSEGNTR